MIKKNIEKLLKEQLNFEIESAFIYRAMAAYCDSLDLVGFAHWFKIQAQEEDAHAEKFYKFIVDRGGGLSMRRSRRRRWTGRHWQRHLRTDTSMSRK